MAPAERLDCFRVIGFVEFSDGTPWGGARTRLGSGEFERHADRLDAPRHSVLDGNQQAGIQTLGSILGPPLRLGYPGKFYIDLLVRDAVEQMPDQV